MPAQIELWPDGLEPLFSPRSIHPVARLALLPRPEDSQPTWRDEERSCRHHRRYRRVGTSHGGGVRVALPVR